MANVTNKKFIKSLCHRLNVSPRVILKYLDGIIDEILRETARGNTVTIDRLGKFHTSLIGGYSQKGCFEGKYVKPRVVLKMKASKQATQELSEAILPTEYINSIEQVDFDNESNYEMTEKTEYGKDDVYLIFEQIKENIKNNKHTFLSETEDEETDED